MASALLWQSDDKSVVLIDVPRSISAAQGTAEHPCSDTLLSSEPLLCPFPSHEPKSDAAKARLQNNTTEESLHVTYRDLVHQALEQVRLHHRGSWCLPRPFIVPPNREAKKRKLDDAENQLPLQGAPPELTDQALFHANKYDYREDLLIKSQTGEELNEKFYIPPFSTFSLSDCSNSRLFSTNIRNQAQDYYTQRHFDLILLDPPWPNRSIKRTHKTPGSTYTTLATLDDVYQLIIGTDLDMLMAENCLVGIWITNKTAVRELVTGPGGIFESWGIELVEEWIWLKTTASGEPVTALDSLWRKPYEVLLLGRKRRSGFEGIVVQRKTIISVPDLHSRKPCLKPLFEPMITDPQSYRALEVFARHLVSGWWSWGNECIKFNWSGYWQAKAETEDA